MCIEEFPLVQRVQERVGVDKLAVALLDVDPEYFKKPEDYLPQAKKILERHKLKWPNAIAPRGFHDTARIFHLSGYGNIVVDGKGIVRGKNVQGKWLEQLVEEMIEGKKPEKPKR